jgi:hypothetical protein
MPAIFRNYLVFANNKRQNIESRLFATGSGFRTGSVAIAYSSFYNKFVSDRPTLFNTVSPKYYASESIASSTSTNLIYQNNRSIYLQNFDIFVQETVSNTLQNETSSLNTSLNTKYYASESVAASSTNNLIYQNNRSIYLQNFDVFIQETVSNTRQSETGSFSTLLKTKYYASESVASSTSTNIVYQNNRSIYLQNFDIFIQETVSNTLQNETSSLNTSLNTKYFLVESNGAGDSIIYQNNKAVYLQNLDIFITEAPPPITRLNETGSSTTILNTKYTLADTVSTSATQIGYQNDRAIYLENNDILIKETISNVRLNETGSNTTSLSTKYILADASSSLASQIGYQNDRAIYLENNDILIKETISNVRLNETGSNNLLLFTNYYMSQSNATGSTLAFQNFKYIYLEDDSYLLTD